jgi:hypothetical protein
MKAELACDPICQYDETSRSVRIIFCFLFSDVASPSVEFSWSDTVPQESGKLLGGAVRSPAGSDDLPLPFELKVPLALFLSPRPLEFRLRGMKPLRTLGHGTGLPTADPSDLAGSVGLELRAWSDLS